MTSFFTDTKDLTWSEIPANVISSNDSSVVALYIGISYRSREEELIKTSKSAYAHRVYARFCLTRGYCDPCCIPNVLHWWHSDTPELYYEIVLRTSWSAQAVSQYCPSTYLVSTEWSKMADTLVVRFLSCAMLCLLNLFYLFTQVYSVAGNIYQGILRDCGIDSSKMRRWYMVS